MRVHLSKENDKEKGPSLGAMETLILETFLKTNAKAREYLNPKMATSLPVMKEYLTMRNKILLETTLMMDCGKRILMMVKV